MKEHDATIEDQYKIFETIDDKQYKINILDTAGEEDYQSLIDQWIEAADGFILVYSIDDKKSFEILEDKYKRIKQIDTGNNCPIIIVGNKSDLEDQRNINQKEAQNWANSRHMKYFETSATSGKFEQVKLVFVECAKEIISKRKENLQQNQNNTTKSGWLYYCDIF